MSDIETPTLTRSVPWIIRRRNRLLSQISKSEENISTPANDVNVVSSEDVFFRKSVPSFRRPEIPVRKLQEEIEYGPGYVRRLRDFYASLSEGKTSIEKSIHVDQGENIEKITVDVPDDQHHAENLIDTIVKNVKKISQEIERATLVMTYEPEEKKQKLEDKTGEDDVAGLPINVLRYEATTLLEITTPIQGRELENGKPKDVTDKHSGPSSSSDYNEIREETIRAVRPAPPPPLRDDEMFASTIRPLRNANARRKASPDRKSAMASADDTALIEMRKLVKKFQERRSLIFEKENTEESKHLSSSYSYSPSTGEFHNGNGCTSFSSGSENDDADDVDFLGDQFKKKKMNFEIISAGSGPRKASLVKGAKRSLEKRERASFSETPPKAYVYLEESIAENVEQWLPGQELSDDQYTKIKREIKQERKQVEVERLVSYFMPPPYYTVLESNADPSLPITPPPSIPYDSPNTAHGAYMIKLQSPTTIPEAQILHAEEPMWEVAQRMPLYAFHSEEIQHHTALEKMVST